MVRGQLGACESARRPVASGYPAKVNRAPDPDQFEVSVLGPGYGEAIVVHLGNGEWLTVDSCIDSRTREVAPMAYLRGLGVNLATQVRLVVTSHWHDDHVAGTPFSRGGYPLPSTSDVERILGYTDRAWSAARMKIGPSAIRDRTVEKTLKEHGLTLHQAQPPLGQVRLRRKLSAEPGDWSVELFMNAVALSDIRG
jgi:glyoxylase-like metal-dependent hydrolase (beta-lactamase superfamily II)